MSYCLVDKTENCLSLEEQIERVKYLYAYVHKTESKEFIFLFTDYALYNKMLPTGIISISAYELNYIIEHED